ncbi:uncharacterized protein LOC110713861 [Chenopodium quinoa]|uniref:Thiol-disulfide oxidoreductase DCC n=1 Tax=Chenopodium quinoa TaxID=63459 RepID=A0A803MBW4_CHEQI|nr:uncharacterized protein LOC110713861 [Chenopodium quinoa]
MTFVQMRNLLLRSRTLKSNPPPIPSPESAPAIFFASSPSPPPPQSSYPAGAVADLVADDDDDEDLHISPVSVVKPAVMPTLLQPRVVVFDGVCRLCHTGVKLIIKADKYEKIKFCCLQSKTAEPYMEICGVERKDVLRRFIFVEGLGQYHQASTAALKVMSYLPFPYSALSSLLVIPTPVRDAVYDYIAKRRYDWCGKEKECLVLKEPELLKRFIDREELLERPQSDI